MNHAIQRAWERYGLRLTVADVLAVQSQICLHRAVLMKSTPDRDTSIWAVSCKGRTCVVMAENITGCIRTFLPLDTSHVQRARRKKFHKATGYRLMRETWG